MRRLLRSWRWHLFYKDMIYQLDRLPVRDGFMRNLLNSDPHLKVQSIIHPSPPPTEQELKSHLINILLSDPNPIDRLHALSDIINGKYWIEDGIAFIGERTDNLIPKVYHPEYNND